MPSQDRTEVETLSAQLEEVWGHLDALFDRLGPKDWSRKHGRDWTFADVPYHLAYCDRDLVAHLIEQGPDLPADEQLELSTDGELDAWNKAKFAARPPDQTPEQTLRQMRASRDEIRRVVAQLSDADLDRPAWHPLAFYARRKKSHTAGPPSIPPRGGKPVLPPLGGVRGGQGPSAHLHGVLLFPIGLLPRLADGTVRSGVVPHPRLGGIHPVAPPHGA